MPSSIKDTLIKTDAKFYAIHGSPLEYELRTIGNIEQEQAEAMKHYIHEVFIPEYTKNFNKGLSEVDIKFYGKIHFDRSRSNNELNMHCHLIVSRKDQANKKKLSPLTNNRSTKNGVIKGGFERVNLFQLTEQGFDKLFNYNRHHSESFDFLNLMKNNTITEQLKRQRQNIQSSKRKTKFSQNSNQENLLSINFENQEASNQKFNTDVVFNQESKTPINHFFNLKNYQISGLFISSVSLGGDSFATPE